MIWWLGGIVVVSLVGGALIAVWKLMGADRAGLFPKNRLKQMRREDGGLGPIAERDQ